MAVRAANYGTGIKANARVVVDRGIADEARISCASGTTRISSSARAWAQNDTSRGVSADRQQSECMPHRRDTGHGRLSAGNVARIGGQTGGAGAMAGL